MNRRRLKLGILGALAVAVPVGALTWSGRVNAADHLDPPSRQTMMGGMVVPGNTADIADVYAWHTGTGATARLVTVLTFAGPNPASATQRIACDRDILYQIHLSNDADLDPETSIDIRFGLNASNQCGVQITNLPGAQGVVTGAVETNLMSGMSRAFAGLRDDPFFFDLTGFRTTAMTGTLSFVNDRDFFAQKNSSAVVLEMPLSAAIGTGTSLRIWATTARARSM